MLGWIPAVVTGLDRRIGRGLVLDSSVQSRYT